MALYHKTQADHCALLAGWLAMLTLLSLVPLLTVLLAVLKLIPGFTDKTTELQSLILQQVVPTSTDKVQQFLAGFIENAGKFESVGFIFLIITGFMLVRGIHKAFGRVFPYAQNKAWYRLLVEYWMIVTIGPLLLAFSLTLSSYLSQQSAAFVYVDGISLKAFLPFLLTVIACFGLYRFSLNAQVRSKDALFGGALAAILFELLKLGFAWYVKVFPNYQLIYGALATVPLFILWVYLSWWVVLLGAELTYLFGLDGRYPKYLLTHDSTEKMITDLTRSVDVLTLFVIHQSPTMHTVSNLKEAWLSEHSDMISHTELQRHLLKLADAELIHQTNTKYWVMTPMLLEMSVKEILMQLTKLNHIDRYVCGARFRSEVGLIGGDILCEAIDSSSERLKMSLLEFRGH